MDEIGEGQNESNSFVDIIVQERKQMVEALVYFAHHLGIRAGVRPNAAPPQPGDEDFPPVKRVVFIDFPEKTLVWGFTEIDENIEWLNKFPQYEQ